MAAALMSHGRGSRRVNRAARGTTLALLVSLVAGACGSTGTSIEGSAPAVSPTRPPTAVATLSPLATESAAVASSSPVLPIQALEVRLESPVGLVFDSAGRLYVSECAFDPRSYIYRIEPGGMASPFAGTGALAFGGDGSPATSASIACPVGMAFGPDGALYFADHVNNRVRRIDTSGIITTVAGSGPAGLNQGSFSGDGGPAIEATLQEPYDVAFDRTGKLFIADRDNNRVRMVDLDGMITTVAGDGKTGFAGDGGPAVAASLNRPLGIAIDAAGNLLIADSGNDRVRKVDLDGTIGTYLGTGTPGSSGDGGPATDATIEEPHDFAFDASGALLVSTGGRIRRIDATGSITTIAGSAATGTGQPADGVPAVQAYIGSVQGLAGDGLGNIFLADDYNSVYRIDTNGILTLFAGLHAL
jgi:sugar lactone lactonase YvrE